MAMIMGVGVAGLRRVCYDCSMFLFMTGTTSLFSDSIGDGYLLLSYYCDCINIKGTETFEGTLEGKFIN